MFKYKFQSLLSQNKKLLQKGSQSIVSPQVQIHFGSQSNQSSSGKNNYHKQFAVAALGTGLLMLSQSLPNKEKKSEAEASSAQEQFQKKKDEIFQPFMQKTVDSFEIPKLLRERELQKQKEYQEREETDITKIEKGITDEEIKDMRQLDRIFNTVPQDGRTDEQEEDEDLTNYVVDPYTKKRNTKMKHQEYRTIKIGPIDLLKNGQMIQVSVCDPFDDTTFHPTDKVIIVKHNNRYYALGSFCGFDFTNLATGAFLGDKLMCPTCGSVYNVENGFVDQGPSLRNLSSFLIQSREEKVQLVMPEHVPAFAMKDHIKRATIDPRCFVILGDSETALSAIDALRTSFTGRIVCLPTSSYGQFENLDILNRKFGKLEKNEAFYVESDYLDRANVEVLTGEISAIDLNRNQIVVRGQKKPIEFDKIMIAWGSNKKRLGKTQTTEFSNVYYLEDRFSHAKCHNQLLKAKTVVIMGGTFEAYQTAASVRDFLDSVGQPDTEVILLDTQISEVQQCFGLHLAGSIHEMLKEKRISVIMNASITKMQGLDKLDYIYFKKANQKEEDKNVEFFIRPDMVIAENGIGPPKHDISPLLTPATHAESGEPPIEVGLDSQGIPSSDIKFSLHYNDIHTPIFAAGSCTQYPSFVHKTKIRTSDVKYNIEAGFFAAMNMLDKRVEFRYFPMTAMKIGETPVYFVGERNQAFHEVIINGDVAARKYVAYFVYGTEVVGFVTVGYQNLHLYLWEAMKLLIMPAAAQLRNETFDYKDIVKAVLRMRPFITCKRHDIIKIPSIMLAEFDSELEKSGELSRKVRQNISQENIVQKQKFQEMKRKLDREGVEFIEDEMDMVDGDRQSNHKATTNRGGRKPGNESSGNQHGCRQ